MVTATMCKPVPQAGLQTGGPPCCLWYCKIVHRLVQLHVSRNKNICLKESACCAGAGQLLLRMEPCAGAVRAMPLMWQPFPLVHAGNNQWLTSSLMRERTKMIRLRSR